ncbi:hypothetical protein CEXT_573351 [Caerostris extrusa]|uniref:Uncharacterized protein n=1 Tax=Caerostris extrusa TaxID=172846 RepID=A0AAV4XVY2_CAEEX|nr:hypothetical protein CEXT_573351 [Caerostris extrusa]
MVTSLEIARTREPPETIRPSLPLPGFNGVWLPQVCGSSGLEIGFCLDSGSHCADRLSKSWMIQQHDE